MSRMWAVVKREFTESVRTKSFILGTLFGPALIGAFFGIQVLMLRGEEAERSIAIVDGTGAGLGEQLAAIVGEGGGGGTRFRVEVLTVAEGGEEEVRARLMERVLAGELDGYLWLPPGVLAGAPALYEGKNATNFVEPNQIRGALQHAVNAARLSRSGVDPAVVAELFRPVEFEARKVGRRGATATAESAFVLAYVLAFIMYLVVVAYGAAVMRGVVEEKKDRIVELVVSSIRPGQLMLGKVLGIGGAGLLQVLIWVAFAALALNFGDDLAGRLGTQAPALPSVPGVVAVTFLWFFVAGFFLYACIYAALGAIATSDQEMQQLQFPVVLLLMAGFMMSFPVITRPDGTLGVVSSLVPFFSPIVMPVRAVVTDVPLVQLLGSALLLAGTGLVALWLAGKIYRIGILATGKRPTAAELLRWLRTA